MLDWQSREDEKGRFANGHSLSYKILTVRGTMHHRQCYVLKYREKLHGAWSHDGTYDNLNAARHAAEQLEDASLQCS